VDRNRLYVRGLDAVDGSPVYDIKPFVPTLDTDALEVELIDHLNQNPRRDITHAIRSSNAARCLIKTAEIHGHFCPGSALGVMASLAGLTHPVIGSVISEGMEDVIAIVEVNACFADGVQVVSGCTLGNNSLIYRDLGRHAVTFAKRGQEQAIRVHVRPGFRSVVSSQVPEFFPLMEKVIKERAGTVEDEADFKNAGKKAAFALVQCPFEQILEIQVVRSFLPPYAPITPTVICSKCGEEMMSTKAVRLETGSYLCRICSRQSYPQVEGQGIVMNNGIADMKA
jgi:formylmethanofuran dehydrogenase subunit E